jgi:tetraacyldisaccharide 4'-kinase
MMKEALHAFVKKDKKTPGALLLKALLWVLSLLYGALVLGRIFLFKIRMLTSVRLPKPVISVGNITTGGTGKTPFVAYVTDHVLLKRKKAAILLRGYMAIKGQPSDEAKWFGQRLKATPILVGEDRVFEANKFLNTGQCDVFVMDDGFQHLKLKRDLDIVMIDATDPWGGGHLLPRGHLREPLSSLSRADIFVLTRTDQAGSPLSAIEQRLAELNARAPIVHSVHQPVKFYDAKTHKEYPLSELKDKKTVVCCSIGCPQAFERTLRQLKADVIASFSFMDHHTYSSQDIKLIVSSALESGVELIVTTEKDLAKWQQFFHELPDGLKLMVLQIELTVTKNEDELLKRIDHLLQR